MDLFGGHFSNECLFEFARRFPATYKILDRYKKINLMLVGPKLNRRYMHLYCIAYDACSWIQFDMFNGDYDGTRKIPISFVRRIDQSPALVFRLLQKRGNI